MTLEARDLMEEAAARFPLRCTHCHSEKLAYDLDDLDLNRMRRLSEDRHVDAEGLERGRRKPRWINCLQCGRKSRVATVRAERQAKIAAYARKRLDAGELTDERAIGKAGRARRSSLRSSPATRAMSQ